LTPNSSQPNWRPSIIDRQLTPGAAMTAEEAKFAVTGLSERLERAIARVRQSQQSQS
jgi:hypothetical protein